MTEPDLATLVALIRDAARAELLPRFTHAAREYKPDGSVVTAADLAMQGRLQQTLAARWPHIRLLGEEMPPGEQQRLLDDDGPLWLLDPLDGTSNFASGVPFFSVSLALLQGGEVRLGLVHDPSRDETFTAMQGGGAYLNGERLGPRPAPPLHRSLALVDLKRLAPPLIQRLAAAPPYASQRSFGSVALEWCWIAAGRGQVYLHGRQQLWDYAAAALILAEAGGRAETLASEPVLRRALEPRSALAALDGGLFAEWRAWVREETRAASPPEPIR